jgi:Zn-dependent peptidase ImmA (M78 family)
LLHLDSYDSDQSEEDSEHELEASIFASYFLMPQDQFEEVWEECRGLNWIDRVLHTKRRFQVSYKTVLRRLIDEYDADEMIYQEFNKAHNRIYGKKLSFKEEPEGFVSDKCEPSLLEQVDFIEDRLSRLVREAIEREVISVSRAAEILHVSVNEMRERIGEWGMFG